MWHPLFRFGNGGAVVPPPAVVVSNSGGYYEGVPRRRSVREERERLGIIPRQVKKIVKAVARVTVAEDKTDYQAERMLAERLAQRDIEDQARYRLLMQIERDRILARDVDLVLRMRAKRARDEEDDLDAEMLLM